MKKLLIIVLLLPLFLMMNVPYSTAAGGTIERIDGANRFEVAVNISKKGWSTTGNTVVLANANAFADALSAAPLAYYKNAPILLTQKDQLTAITKQEMIRLSPSEVILVGGKGSISDQVISEIKSLGIHNVRRIAGNDRFEVSAAIAAELPASSKIVIADGTKFPDALAIAPYAARNGYPILLTLPNSLPSKIQNAVKARNAQSSIVVGGLASVSSQVASQLPAPQRIGGSDRYEVAANIIRQLNMKTDKVFLATGLSFADALTGSVLAAKQNAPILLTHSNYLPEATKKIIIEKSIIHFTVLGGLASVPAKVVNQTALSLLGLTIVVDAGHGGSDTGAIGNGLKEKDITLDVAKRLQSKLSAQGAKVVMTRTSDTYPTLTERVEMANSIGADVFVSIHINSSTSPSASGTETYWNRTYAAAESKELATYIQRELIDELGTKDRGVKEANFYVIKNSKMASVLTELAFISNSNDANLLKTSTFREKAAQAIFQGISAYWKNQ